MLSGLRAKAVSGNTMYAALKGPRAGYSGVDYYKQLPSRATFNGIAYNWSWSCQSGTGLPTGSGASPYQLAQTANAFAFMALIDPSDPTYNWGCYGHDVWMYIVNAFNAGSYRPGQDEVRNQAAALGLATDWLLGSGGLTTSGDISACRTYVANM